MQLTALDPRLVDRFRNDIHPLIPEGARFGLAVSGGADSLAMLLLAWSAFPDKFAAATVDHALREESGSECETVASICAALGIEHATLKVVWPQPPRSNIQSACRDGRYMLLREWARGRGLAAVATAHHADDQAETLLLRAARGSGVGGLGGIQPSRPLADEIALLRPLLTWRRPDLRQIVESFGLVPVDDPSNRDRRFDRTAARALLKANDWLDPLRLAATASHCRDSDEALQWATRQALEQRLHKSGRESILDVTDLPLEIRRRLLLAAIQDLGAPEPRGPDLLNAVTRLEAGQTVTLAGLKLEGGSRWRLTIAPPRRR